MGKTSPSLRRTALVFLILGVGAGITLVFVRYSHPGAVLSALATVLVTVVTVLTSFRDLIKVIKDWIQQSGTDQGLSLSKVADQLAKNVEEVWQGEEEKRRINDPPLRVSWQAVDANLVEKWDDVVQCVKDEWRNWPHSDPAGWAIDPTGLAGSGLTQFARVLGQVPTGRLLVLGKPGAGKTMLLARLMWDRPTPRSPGDPVPVLVSLASWRPAEQDLIPWLIEQLPLTYPMLEKPAPPDTGKRNRAAALLAEKLLIPVLDGLDELPKSAHADAFLKINKWLKPGAGLVVSCRTEHYLEVVKSSKSKPLAGTAGVEICDLDPNDVGEYLERDSGWAGANRWKPVVDCLGKKTPVGLALRTPLMVSMARTIYNYAGKDTGSPRDPAELCKEDRFPEAKNVEKYLFDAFIKAAYEPHPAKEPCKWSVADATQWLVYLANHLKNLQARTHLEDQPSRWSVADAKRWLAKLATHLKGTAGEGESTADNDKQNPDFLWWRLREAAPRLSGLAVGIVSGLATGFTAGFGAGIGAGIGIGLGVGLLLGLWVRWLVRKRWEPKTEPVQGLVGGLVGGLLGGFAAGPTSLLGIELIGIGHSRGLTGGLLVGLGVGMGIGPASGFRGGLFGGLIGGLGGGLVGALGLGVGPGAGLVNGVGVGLTGVPRS
jgi:NACHT domain